MNLDFALDFADGVAADVDQGLLEQAARAALEVAGSYSADGVVELAVRCVDRPESAALNDAYRGRPGATNVLSFVAGARLPGLVALGDLVICLPVVTDEAGAQGKTLAAHLCHMVVHGVLHLLGHDHIDPVEADTMEKLERKIMAGLGYDDPYHEIACA